MKLILVTPSELAQALVATCLFWLAGDAPTNVLCCSSPSMWTTRYNTRDPQNLVNEIKMYQEKYNITGLQFYDLTMILSKKWIIKFCKLLIENNIQLKWSPPVGTRTEALDEESLSWIKKTNCSYLVYAPESGSQETLQNMKKRLKLPRIISSIKTAKRLGLITRANIVIGFPGESRKQLYKPILLIWKFALYGVDDIIVNIFYAYPGSPLFYKLVDEGRLEVNQYYFNSLTTHHEFFGGQRRRTYNEVMGKRELSIYRLFGFFSFYTLSYTLRPWRIIRTIIHVIINKGTTTALLETLK